MRFLQINLHNSKKIRNFAADIGLLYTMMQLVNNGTVLFEREKPHVAITNTLTLRAKRLSHGIKKTVRPQLMSKEDFFANVINKASNGNV